MQKLKIPEFCSVSGDWGKLRIPNIIVGMCYFRDAFETFILRSFISAFLVCMTVPLTNIKVQVNKLFTFLGFHFFIWVTKT